MMKPWKHSCDSLIYLRMEHHEETMETLVWLPHIPEDETPWGNHGNTRVTPSYTWGWNTIRKPWKHSCDSLIYLRMEHHEETMETLVWLPHIPEDETPWGNHGNTHVTPSYTWGWNTMRKPWKHSCDSLIYLRMEHHQETMETLVWLPHIPEDGTPWGNHGNTCVTPSYTGA